MERRLVLFNETKTKNIEYYNAYVSEEIKIWNGELELLPYIG